MRIPIVGIMNGMRDRYLQRGQTDSYPLSPYI